MLHIKANHSPPILSLITSLFLITLTACTNGTPPSTTTHTTHTPNTQITNTGANSEVGGKALNSGVNSGVGVGVYPIDLIGLKRVIPDTFSLTHLGLRSIQLNDLTLTASANTVNDRLVILNATAQPTTTPSAPTTPGATSGANSGANSGAPATTVNIQLQNFPDPALTQSIHQQLAIQIKKYNAKPRHYLYERP